MSLITPPQLLNAYFSGDKEIILTFDQLIEIGEDYYTNGEKYLIKDQFLFNLSGENDLINGVVGVLNVKNKKIIIPLKSD